MHRRVLPLLVVVLAVGQPAAARAVGESYGPPSPKPAHLPDDRVSRDVLGGTIEYREAEGVLAANGIKIADGGARRPIAPNTEVAVEPARGLFNEFGEAKKPMRLLLRVGTNF